ncbi:glycogen debranching protein [Herbiconiux sp. VKM Ac-1786]|uniref:amylo-alpha-1,6-glucosidase n=1 Tax=Herbiconiux sp. VKM Ac-1786 TaxID=2783824 RepID=UPI00188DB04C|nr:glycogen debranching protein [Herbiconiux sp. VKM Ac-1786]MBF4572064.1 glycogen debranching protein [Herbiconiux sp. VKM Ac-1786]
MSRPSSLDFDVRQIPFSRRRSWLDISPVVGLHTVREQLHLVSHRTGMHPIFAFEPTLPVVTVEAGPARLSWVAADDARVDAVFESESAVRLRGRGLGLRIADATPELTPFTGTYFFRDPIDGSAVFTSYETGRRYRISRLRGELELHGAEALGESERAVTARGAEWEIVIEEYETALAPYTSATAFDDIVDTVAGEFDDYVERIAGWRTEDSPAVVASAYVLWSATVSPAGFLERESVFMSKHWMDKVWSWDHCFNALALAPGLPAEALDQFRIVFDFQDPSGALPDSVTHSEVLYNFVKPPIHGWAFRKLRGLLAEPVGAVELREIYDALVRWTGFWLERRRVPGHPLAHYQHGNDSGWDNSTTFDHDRLIEAPDLAAFLVVQLSVLAELAAELGLPADAARWRDEGGAMLAALTGLWDEDVFVARAAAGGRASKKTSLLNTLPIVASPHLTRQHSERLARRIEQHLTEFGPATQLVDTPEYEADGYWRGPIWAPSTAIVEDGLRAAGETALADTISARFRRLCERSGFAENFDALTGAGLRDRAYTWTAAVYLTLAREAAARAAAGGGV